MGTELILEGNGGGLLIETAVNELGWSQCYLLGEKRVYLGAESADYLLPRLLDVVDGGITAYASTDEIEGRPVHWALSLSEVHHALYVADDGPDTLLFWQDARKEPVAVVGTIRLSPERCRQWETHLRASLNNYQLNRSRQATIAKEIVEMAGGAEVLK